MTFSGLTRLMQARLIRAGGSLSVLVVIAFLSGCANTAPQPTEGGMTNSFFLFNTLYFLALLWFGYYFLVIRPNVLKEKDRKDFVDQLKKGDEVITTGGIYGKLVSVEGDSAIIEIDRTTKIRIKLVNLTIPVAQKKTTEIAETSKK